MAVSPKKHRVAVFAFPFGGHAAALFALTCRLAAKAPHAIFSFFTTPCSKASLSSSPRGPNHRLYAVADGVPDEYVFQGKPQEDIELFMKATPGNFVGGRGESGRDRCELLSHRFFSVVCGGDGGGDGGAVGDVLDQRRLQLLGAPVSSKDEQLNIIPGFSKVRVGDLPDGVVWGRIDSLFSCLLHRMAKESILRAAAVAINTFEGLESTILNDLRLKFPHKHCLPVGPLPPPHHPPQQHPHAACLALLDRFPPSPSPSVVYISFGTIKMPPPEELKALAEGLEESGVPFLWSLKEKAMEDGLPEGFVERTKERGLVVPWAPQTMVLEHGAVGAFVTHFGWNSVLEGIAAGVPMSAARC
ncbi:hypothetical protein ACLOJK_040453 [Asimina triloba]